MAAPLKTGKQTVDLAAGGVRVSRIRRNPPPAPKKEPILDREERETIGATVGVITISLALVVAILGVGIYAGWSPADYELFINMD
jgi:hypothetical protein